MAKDFIIRSGGLGVSQSPVRALLHVSGTISGSLIRSSGDVVAFFSSDERLKDNIQPIQQATYKLKQVGGYEFDWNEKQTVYEGHDVGVIAQEIEKVLPEVVAQRADGYLAVKYEKIIPLLIEGFKEQQKEIESLKEEIQKLKNG
jgi:hypothetical protein